MRCESIVEPVSVCSATCLCGIRRAKAGTNVRWTFYDTALKTTLHDLNVFSREARKCVRKTEHTGVGWWDTVQMAGRMTQRFAIGDGARILVVQTSKTGVK